MEKPTSGLFEQDLSCDVRDGNQTFPFVDRCIERMQLSSSSSLQLQQHREEVLPQLSMNPSRVETLGTQKQKPQQQHHHHNHHHAPQQQQQQPGQGPSQDQHQNRNGKFRTNSVFVKGSGPSAPIKKGSKGKHQQNRSGKRQSYVDGPDRSFLGSSLYYGGPDEYYFGPSSTAIFTARDDEVKIEVRKLEEAMDPLNLECTTRGNWIFVLLTSTDASLAQVRSPMSSAAASVTAHREQYSTRLLMLLLLLLQLDLIKNSRALLLRQGSHPCIHAPLA